MASKREYPEFPMVGVGGVVVRDGRALLIRRGSEPLKGEWSIPGGMLDVGETLIEGVSRELLEETGLRVSVIELIEVFERIFPGDRHGHVDSPADSHSPVYDAGREQDVSQRLAVSEPPQNPSDPPAGPPGRPLYHFVIIDYLCEAAEGVPRAGSDVTDVVFAAEEDLARFHLTPAATRIVKKAFAMARARKDASPRGSL